MIWLGRIPSGECGSLLHAGGNVDICRLLEDRHYRVLGSFFCSGHLPCVGHCLELVTVESELWEGWEDACQSVDKCTSESSMP